MACGTKLNPLLTTVDVTCTGVGGKERDAFDIFRKREIEGRQNFRFHPHANYHSIAFFAKSGVDQHAKERVSFFPAPVEKMIRM